MNKMCLRAFTEHNSLTTQSDTLAGDKADLSVKSMIVCQGLSDYLKTFLSLEHVYLDLKL